MTANSKSTSATVRIGRYRVRACAPRDHGRLSIFPGTLCCVVSTLTIPLLDVHRVLRRDRCPLRDSPAPCTSSRRVLCLRSTSPATATTTAGRAAGTAGTRARARRAGVGGRDREPRCGGCPGAAGASPAETAASTRPTAARRGARRRCVIPVASVRTRLRPIGRGPCQTRVAKHPSRS